MNETGVKGHGECAYCGSPIRWPQDSLRDDGIPFEGQFALPCEGCGAIWYMEFGKPATDDGCSLSFRVAYSAARGVGMSKDQARGLARDAHRELP